MPVATLLLNAAYALNPRGPTCPADLRGPTYAARPIHALAVRISVSTNG